MDYIYNCLSNLKEIQGVAEKLIILESTVYPGASEEIIEKLGIKMKL